MIISVASGRGGSGKTTVATGLALALQSAGRQLGVNRLVFVDCDVEMPSAGHTLRPLVRRQTPVEMMLPRVDETLCTHCGHCAEVCQYGAIAVVDERTMVFPRLCRGCGSCSLECPENAISEEPHRIGQLSEGRVGSIRTYQAELKVGSSQIGHAIRHTKARAMQRTEDAVVILDAPTGCATPLVETLRGSDYVILVAEPTPLGLASLRRAVMLAHKQLDLLVGVVINRDSDDYDGIAAFCDDNGIPILMHIPPDERITSAALAGRPGLVGEAYGAALLAAFGRIVEEVAP